MVYDHVCFTFSGTVSVEGTYRFESIVGSIKLMSTDCDFWKISGDAGHVATLCLSSTVNEEKWEKRHVCFHFFEPLDLFFSAFHYTHEKKNLILEEAAMQIFFCPKLI